MQKNKKKMTMKITTPTTTTTTVLVQRSELLNPFQTESYLWYSDPLFFFQASEQKQINMQKKRKKNGMELLTGQ